MIFERFKLKDVDEQKKDYILRLQREQRDRMSMLLDKHGRAINDAASIEASKSRLQIYMDDVLDRTANRADVTHPGWRNNPEDLVTVTDLMKKVTEKLSGDIDDLEEKRKHVIAPYIKDVNETIEDFELSMASVGEVNEDGEEETETETGRDSLPGESSASDT